MVAARVVHDGPIRVIDYCCTAGPRDAPFVEHHTDHCVSYVRSGSFGYSIEGQPHELVAGSVLVGRPGADYVCSHEHHPRGDECLSFHFDAAVAEALGPERTWHVGALPPLSELVVIGELAQAAAAGSTDVAMDEVAAMFVGRFVELAAERTPAVSALRVEDRRRAVEVAMWLDANAEREISLAESAAQAGLSSFHFLRVFRAVLGVTPHQYLVRARLRRAARLLAASPLPITDVALDVGFADLSNFVRTFHRAAGQSPRRFRATARSSKRA